jgi:uncharacterized membrane protein
MTTSLPFPGMPYRAAPAWCFPFVEVSVYLLFLVCFRHAYKRGGRALAFFLGGLVFGVLLEYFEVATHSYTYGRFWLMVGRAPLDAPIWVGCGWAVIMYTGRLFSDAVGLPLFAAAAFDALLALNIDLSLDVVAYRLHMWHWQWNGTTQNPLTAQWFGIPYGNFIGWIIVVFCYSAFSRMLERIWLKSGLTAGRLLAVAVTSILCSLTVLMTAELLVFPFVARYLGLTSGRRLLLIGAALLMLTVRGWPRNRGRKISVDPMARLLPCWFHVIFVSWFFGFGFYRENPWMTAAACGNVLLGVAVHVNWGSRQARYRHAGERARAA